MPLYSTGAPAEYRGRYYIITVPITYYLVENRAGADFLKCSPTLYNIIMTRHACFLNTEPMCIIK